MRINYRKPCDGSEAGYDPETEGYFIVAFKVGTTQHDLYVPPLPSNHFVQLACGWVGTPCGSIDGAMREMCAVYARWPDNGRFYEICKCPVAFAARESFVFITDQPDARMLELAKNVDWNWGLDTENYKNGVGRFA